MGILIQAAQLILSLGLLIAVHELGHFWAARAFKTRVDKFYLFFNPWFSILRAKRVNKKWRFSWFSPAPPKSWEGYPDNTEWGIGWLPIGGSCKIAGMIDEHMDTDAVKQPMQAWEYRAKPAWQRLIMITGGVLVNFATALIIYSMMLYAWGREYIPIANATYGYDYCQPALNSGFAGGDVILAVDGKTPETLGDAMEQILYASGKPVTLLRAGDTVQLTLPANFAQLLVAANIKFFAQERIPFVVDKVTGGSPAAAAALQEGDSIVGLNGASVPFLAQLSDSLLRYAGKPIELSFYRNGELLSREVTPTDNGKLGVGLRSSFSFFKTKRLEYGFFEAIPAGIVLGTETLVSYVRQFKIVFSTKEGAKSLGGFGSIGSLFDKTWNWARFWGMTAFVSIILAFLNILPIPAFDGGHMMFILYEMVSGRKPSDKFLETTQMVGFFIIIILFVVANGNDIMRWLASR